MQCVIGFSRILIIYPFIKQIIHFIPFLVFDSNDLIGGSKPFWWLLVAMQNLIERDLVIYRIGYCISTVTMDHDRIHRILELNNQLLKTNAELIRAIRERAKPAVINDIRKSIKAIKGEISHIELEGVDNQPSSS